MINISHNKRFIVNAIVLTIFTLLMRAIGTFFGVYLSNKIGPETIGLYQIVSSVYLLAITIAISGIGIAIVRLVSEQIAKKNYYRAKVAFSRCVKLSFLLSVTASVLMFFNAREIGVVFLKDERTISSLKLLSFELPFLAVSACIRNFFIASKMINKTVIGDVIEQMFLIVCAVPLVTLMLPKGIESACCAVVIGGMVGEICSCL
ncbi:MAG: oligosaccharide flippase family protein, partial [Oscillospiraceae bacterium]